MPVQMAGYCRLEMARVDEFLAKALGTAWLLPAVKRPDCSSPTVAPIMKTGLRENARCEARAAA